MSPLQESQLLYTFDHAPIGICILDAKTLVAEKVNEKFLEVAGKPYEEIYGKFYWDAFAEVRDIYEDALNTVIRTGEAFHANEVELQLIRHGKEESIFVNFVYSPIKNNGQVEKVTIWVMENTLQVAARQKIVAINSELDASKQGMEDVIKDSIEINQKLQASNTELSASRDELRRTLFRLSESEGRARSIVEAAPFPIGVYIGREMRIMFVNKSITDVWGKGPDVVGKLYREVLPELEEQGVYPQLDAVFTTGIPFEARSQRIDLVVNGEPKIFYFNYNFTPLINDAGEIYGVMNTAADVTDNVLAKQEVQEISDALAALNEELASINEELTASNEEQTQINNELSDLNEKYKVAQDELQLAIDAASLATFDLNPRTGRFIGNNLLKSWFGLKSTDEIILNEATDQIDEKDRNRVVAAINHALSFESGGDYDVQYSIYNSINPIPRIVRAKGKTQFDENKQAVRLSGVLQDVTEQAQDEQRKNDFIGMVSHELKTPLTTLTAIVQVLHSKLKSSDDSFVAGALDKAKVQVKKMSSLINGFLNISRLESGKIQMEKSKFNLKELIENVISETKVISDTHVINLSPCESTVVYADHDKIGSVISNLLSNAVKYSEKGTAIELQCHTRSGEIEVSVTDHGMGIEPADIKFLFDRFYRVDNPNYSHISGFGIGLYLSSEIIRQHNGRIWVESQKGKGSTFYFTLPL
ncbi:ATP-binding protein [Daejeonella lutea]|uniref:histidine kinase n=1 Tax=Daejeonella lutea TaxID=572036 RepID=A0A1T5B2W0_9SPHI|nr:ATP-binding protein [Daejeonella lutea]SKB41588.1 PAS fold-containing protein [Daejeonella lutea]